MMMSLERFQKSGGRCTEYVNGHAEEVWCERMQPGDDVYRIIVTFPGVSESAVLIVRGIETAYRTIDAIVECMKATVPDPLAFAGLLIGTSAGRLPELGTWVVSHAASEGDLYGSIMRYAQCVESTC